MTDTPDSVNRIELIERLLLRISEQQALNTEAIADLSQEMRELTSNTNRVLGRRAILDDVLLEMRESTEQHRQAFELHQRNFEEHQREFREHQLTTNAALASLEAILAQLLRILPQG
ncbi:hypothetical protein [Dendronalium sp. ChiSLP03b]|uniref:hypothetical protein n=1 Tax=Dendronalium sp. ChiSLP03b TaxID=3075381 RepID=UPI00391B7CEB